MKQILTLLLAYISVGVLAKENIPNPNINNVTYSRVAAGCSPSSSQTDMDVNNVRATILGGGDMWWDFSNARYVVPNVPLGSGLLEVSSIYAGAIWLGGWEFDEDGNPVGSSPGSRKIISHRVVHFSEVIYDE